MTSGGAAPAGSWQAALPGRIARDGELWANTTIALEAWKKAAAQPGRVAIFLEHEPDASYGALALEARRLIAAFLELGLEAGDVVSFQLPNWPTGAPSCATSSGMPAVACS
jgi:non-ribosomal peptide synthetase component E (peptide arylation enzyme)